MLDSPWLVWFLSVAYLLFVWLGPKYLRDKKPFDLRTPMIIHNIALVVFSTYMCIEIFLSTWDGKYDYICAPYNLQTRENPKELRVAKVLYLHFISKSFELLDTVWMVLRKKDKQVTYLHIYHHVLIINCWWWVMKFAPGGVVYFPACFNSFIHALMYTYYLLASVPALRPYLWWKKYITRLQMTQFVAVFLHVALNMYLRCDYPLWGQLLVVWISLSLLVLFGNFYWNAYRRSSHATNTDKTSTNGRYVESKKLA
ncbi:hypothetical protein NP493_479g01016 [Ridgeia piscesae]|uniref:Elongation of very long chain fatty acids protein n=1 Tax=Ridgeia piscesae TaxID=27915 RepID=A0AAD9NR39_RIDPI|nr:hypothetical protein NP493_479g01016 [Ridgeia piscesae]